MIVLHLSLRLLMLSIDQDPVVPLIAVDSFLPLLKTLPALVLDQNTYVRKYPKMVPIIGLTHS